MADTSTGYKLSQALSQELINRNHLSPFLPFASPTRRTVSQKLRQQRLGQAEGSPVTETIYTHVISEDGKRIAAQLGKAIWGVLDPSWTLKENGSGVESPKPLYLN